MQSSLLWLLGGCILAAAGAYRLGFGRDSGWLAARAKAGFIFMVSVLIPCLVVVLGMQATAKSRLMQYGIVPHPAAGESVGVATGLGRAPAWVFRVKAAACSPADFYVEDAMRSGWQMSVAGEDVVLKKNDRKMWIGVQNSWGTVYLSYVLMAAAETQTSARIAPVSF
ncbi:MAG: hypothetical protein NC924_05460 [Candidatus Omnitrophica bacterium]|nr:hypothetical protein [Candidatus Omnitrophota bacterium]